MENFTVILKDLIDESELSLRQLAKVSGVSSGQYSRYLAGRSMTIEVGLRIAKYFDCSLDYLFGLDKDKNSNRYKTYEYNLNGIVDKYHKLLERNKVSGRQFAKENYISKTIVSNWKSGKKPKLDVLYLIAKELGGSIDELIGRY